MGKKDMGSKRERDKRTDTDEENIKSGIGN